VRLERLRTVAIIAALAAVVAFVPHGNTSAGLVATVINVALAVIFVLFGVRLYQMFRAEIYGLGEPHRASLYASIGGFVLAMAWRTQLVTTGAGTLLFVVMLSAVLAGLFACFTRWRSGRV
jgi:hypothetical protein